MEIDDVRVKQGETVDLSKCPTDDPVFLLSKKQADERLGEVVDELRILQERLYADRSQSLLLIFQGMDAAGKDSAIRHILTGINPAGVRVHNYDKPSRDEYRQSFLQRHWLDAPVSGHIGVFNRSHYEEVVVVRVFPSLLKLRETHVEPGDEGLWAGRFEDIRAFEEHLFKRNRTHILKFFLHVSKQRQLQRFRERLEDPTKHWKFDERDIENREQWDAFQVAYAQAIEATSVDYAPWFIIPSDRKFAARLMIAKIILGKLRQMDPQFPHPKVDLQVFKDHLV